MIILQSLVYFISLWMMPETVQPSVAQPGVAQPGVAQPDYCDVYGTIYVEEYPENADYLVYEEASEAFAKIIVFEEGNRLMADRRGKWFFTDTRQFARYTVYFTEKRHSADFSVYFTEFESFAGCSK